MCPLLVFSVEMLPHNNISERGCCGLWWLWSRGQLAVIFPDSFAGILGQYIQWDLSAGACLISLLLLFFGLQRLLVQSLWFFQVFTRGYGFVTVILPWLIVSVSTVMVMLGFTISLSWPHFWVFLALSSLPLTIRSQFALCKHQMFPISARSWILLFLRASSL